MTSPSHPVLVRVHTNVPGWRKAQAKSILRPMLLTLMQDIDNDKADVWDLAFAAERAGVKAMEALSEE